jgi:Domain of unknown function (DUF6933)
MVVIRCTQKLLRRIGPAEPTNVKSTARLGDWSANLIGVAQRRFVLLVSEPTRLPVVVRASDLRNLGRNFPEMLVPVLHRLNIDHKSIERELGEMMDVSVTTTNSRSVLGSINDFSHQIKWRLYDDPDVDLIEVSLWLSETPIMIPFGGDSPRRLVRKVLT